MSKPQTEQEFIDSFEDEEIEDRLNHAFKLGTSSGLEQAAGVLMAKAVEYFKVKNHDCDELASRFRDVSFELKKLAESAHPGVGK